MQFKPGWKLTILCLALLPVLISLGFWQLQRAREKVQILETIAERRASTPLPFSELSAMESPAYTQVLLRGHYVQGPVVLLDNQIYRGRFGYEWLQPFRLNAGPLVLVSRGWLPGSLHREELPHLPPVTGERQVRAEVYVPLGEAFTLAEPTLPAGWPKRVQVIDMEALASALNETLYPYVLRVKAEDRTALIAHWQDVNIQPQKHTGYAVQWFAMAITLLIMYLLVGFGKMGSHRGAKIKTDKSS